MVRIEHFTEKHIPDPNGNVSSLQFHEARNAVVTACRLHGPTGPFGVLPLDKLANFEEWLPLWEQGDPNAAYFVVDDQYNTERYQYVECSDPDFFTQEWIQDLMAAMQRFPGWGIGIASIPDGYILVFADKVMVRGSCFDTSSDLQSVVEVACNSLNNRNEKGNEQWSGECKHYSFEGDHLVCELHIGKGIIEECTIDRSNVESIFCNPFTEVPMLSLHSGLMIELPDETALNRIRSWFEGHA